MYHFTATTRRNKERRAKAMNNLYKWFIICTICYFTSHVIVSIIK